MSLSSKVDVTSHAQSRLGSLQAHLTSHVNTTSVGLRKAFSGQPLNELLALKPVQAVGSLAKNLTDGIVDDVIMGNVEVAIDSVKSQAAITRQGRA